MSHLFSSISGLSIPRPSFTSLRSESVPRSVCFSVQQPQLNHGVKANKEKQEAVKDNLGPENKEEYDEDGDQVNKETGEVGGPKGPEPPRYGDWERNGRCYDF